MRLRVLGCSGGYPTPESASTGYLLEEGDARIWLDAGNGTFSMLQRYADFRRLDAMVLSHLHADHCLDIYPLYIALRYGEVKPAGKLPVYGAPGTQEFLERLVDGEPGDRLDVTYDFREVDEGGTMEVAGVRFSFLRTDHPGHTLAVRAESATGSLTYSADTGPQADLAAFARGTDLLLCEATYQNARKGAPLHLTAEQAAETARRAGAGQLVLTHFWPGNDLEISRREAEAAAGGIPVHLARPGALFEVGPGR
jgi:ribonuclease BN (tRNA processing enzyme)